MRFVPSIIFLAVMILALLSISSASAALPGYAYQKDHTIAGMSDSPLHDYQVAFSVHRGSGVDAGGEVFLNNHSLSWPYDIRFIGQAGNELDYWVQSHDSSSAIIWVRVDDIPASPGSATVSIFYGKAGDTWASDIEHTFILGDDFKTFDQSRWHNNDYVSLQSDTEIRIPTPGKAFYESNAIASRSQDFVPGQALLIRLKGNSETTHYNIFFGREDDNNMVVLRGEWRTRETRGHTYSGGHESSTGDISSDKGQYHVYEIRRDPDGKSVGYAVDGTLMATLNNNVYAGPGPIMVGPWVSGSIVTVDWIAVRQYVPDEPSHGSWSDERSANGLLGPGDRSLLLIGAGLCASAVIIVSLIILVLLAVRTLRKK